jgi:hypothetical protein
MEGYDNHTVDLEARRPRNVGLGLAAEFKVEGALSSGKEQSAKSRRPPEII